MRVKRSVQSSAKHHKLLRANKGYRMTKRRLVKVAKEAYLHAGEYAFAGRKQKKRDFRELWISRISSAIRPYGLNYSTFMAKLTKNQILINRKVLAILVSEKPKVFEAIVKKVK